ncbi:hypothetical protein [Photobacterium sp. 53610]|uniref:hypothetical protein n=1 Tax=Photobacterium sp. 53610 TaxID=3102789 RepID=UPI002ED9672F
MDTAQKESFGLLGDAAIGIENFFAHQDNKQKFFTATKQLVTDPQNEALPVVLKTLMVKNEMAAMPTVRFISTIANLPSLKMW